MAVIHKLYILSESILSHNNIIYFITYSSNHDSLKSSHYIYI